MQAATRRAQIKAVAQLLMYLSVGCLVGSLALFVWAPADWLYSIAGLVLGALAFAAVWFLVPFYVDPNGNDLR